MNIINIVETIVTEVLGTHSFHNTEKGKKEAEEFFKQIIKDNDIDDDYSDEMIKRAFEEGSFEEGEYQVSVSYSHLNP